MKSNYLVIALVFSLFLGFKNAFAFVPAEIIDYILDKIDRQTKLDFGLASDTIVHEEIIRRGVIQSVVRYFYDQVNGSRKINMSKINNDYYDLKKLYYDYYGKWICRPDLYYLISLDFKPNVAIVDLDPRTKDLPYAHFDAEKFVESNQRVIEFNSKILDYIRQKNYPKARQLSGQILHTIQDFYSHSNWIEMGNTNRINTDIGSSNFNKLAWATLSDNQTCINNCTLMSTECNTFTKLLVLFMKTLNIGSAFDCPFRFFKCSGNIASLDKLVSGYYTGQKLDDGSSVTKPYNPLKCSHGGVMDSDSGRDPKGGINKDSGYYLFSPHADLHLIAAELAVNHTEYFLNQIRNSIGDEEFDKFLMLKITQEEIDSMPLIDPLKCSAFATKSLNLILILNHALFFYYFFFKIF